MPIPRYDFAEAGNVGGGCAQPRHSDDIHLFRDAHAVIQHERRFPWGDREIGSFLFTSLFSSAPKIMLNVEMDDSGIIETRRCGCQYEQYDFVDHLHTIRSFSKLTGEGMTIMNSDFLRILEEVLPKRYGGDSTNYQLVEEEDEKGYTRLTLLVHPRLGQMNEHELLDVIQEELKQSAHVRRETRDFMLQMWSQAKTLQVRREPPISTKQGKLLPFLSMLPKGQ